MRVVRWGGGGCGRDEGPLLLPVLFVFCPFRLALAAAVLQSSLLALALAAALALSFLSFFFFSPCCCCGCCRATSG